MYPPIGSEQGRGDKKNTAEDECLSRCESYEYQLVESEIEGVDDAGDKSDVTIYFASRAVEVKDAAFIKLHYTP